MGQPPQVHVRLYDLRAEDEVFLILPRGDGFNPAVESESFWAQLQRWGWGGEGTRVKQRTSVESRRFEVEVQLRRWRTSSGVRLVAGPGDLGRLLHLVASLVGGGPVGAQGNHTAREAGQVTHLVLQEPPFPLSYVGEAPAGLPHQVGFYRLKDRR